MTISLEDITFEGLLKSIEISTSKPYLEAIRESVEKRNNLSEPYKEYLYARIDSKKGMLYVE